MTDTRYARQVLAFGAEGQERLQHEHAAIIGLGGLGSHVAQQLAYLGVRQFTIIDDDRVEESNLNRLIGATSSDVSRTKVGVVGDVLRRIDGSIRVRGIEAELRTRVALKSLGETTAVFGCLDNDGARLVLTEYCCAFRKLYIDSATEITPASTNQELDFGGRVVVSIPGEFCLDCANELDMEAAKQDLETYEVRRQRVAHGYGIGTDAPAPAVVSLNGVIASLAVTEFMVAVTGVRAPQRKLTYKGMRGVVHVTADTRRPDCMNCGYLAGIGDRADILRYVLDRS